MYMGYHMTQEEGGGMGRQIPDGNIWCVDQAQY